MAGTITEVLTSGRPPVKVITLTCTGDGSDGSFPATALTNIPHNEIGGRLLQIATDPGSTAPTANYDITVTEAGGADLLLGVGANRHTSASEVAITESNGAYAVYAGTDTLTITIANSSVNDATIAIKIYYTEGV